jgi:hypothetical protein
MTMLHRIRNLILLVVLSWGGLVLAFNPPVDKQAGMTMSIDGVAAKVATDKPLVFSVTLKNERAQAVSGTLKLWLNDDWQVVGGSEVAISAAPGQSTTITGSAKARGTVLGALYPVHARLALAIDGKAVELHPIAIFEAAPPVAAKAAVLASETVLAEGVFRLDNTMVRQVFVRQQEKITDLGVNFSGADPASGATMMVCETRRGDMSRSGFTVHPPYRGPPGLVWNEFKLALPVQKPIVLTFFTALRDHHAPESASDGTEFKVQVIGQDNVEKELFTRFSDSKIWEPATVDLGAYAGQHITLRLWTGPGPKNNTNCDQCFWGDPVISVGKLPARLTARQWQVREQGAVFLAKQALTKKPRCDTGAFRLEANGRRFGAAVVLGEQGLTDGVIAFADGTQVLTYRGFACDIDKAAVGGVENGQPVMRVETSVEGDAWLVTHQVARPAGTLAMRARIRAEGGALRISWDMPGARRDARGSPRYTRLGIGAGSEPVWRAYAGFGNVIENPGAFELHGGGFTLSTRHVGADYPNGLSLVQACDVFPDCLRHTPSTQRLALETAHDASFLLIPSAQGAFAAARIYRDLCGFKKGPGVDALLGRICLDQWGGDYLAAANDLKEAARYGVSDAIFVKHVWQRWGYDYRLPEIYPPAGGLEPFLAMRTAAAQAGMLFCPHDNYIDFYPDAEGYSYDRIVFHENGQPMKAWLNSGRQAQSYRWLPHGFRPWLEPNMRRMHDGFGPDSLFIDVFTAIPPFDYYDRAGTFYPRMRTAKEWCDAFDTCRKMLKPGSPMLSEAGTDALIGSLDGGQADHFAAARWLKEFKDAERTPWHDMATHGRMVLFSGGLGPRYSAPDWKDHGDNLLHGYGSDDYLSNTVIGGRNPMCDGPFSRRAVMTYWLLHDVCNALARSELETHEFGAGVHQQHTTFSVGGQVWVNRGANQAWMVADGRQLPEYGFYAATPKAQAGVVLVDGQRAGFAKSPTSFFADARPVHNSLSKMRVESAATNGKYLGDGAFEVSFDWNVLDPGFEGYVPFIHVCTDKTVQENDEHIVSQADMKFDRALLRQAGRFVATARIVVPSNLPAGKYQIRYGLYHTGGLGDRLPIRGLAAGGWRIRGGILKLEKNGTQFANGTFDLETAVEDPALGVNVAGKILDFGPLATNGAFRLLHADRKTWQLIPLPGSNPFKAEIRLAEFGAKRAKVKAIEKIDPFNAAAKDPEWKQEGDRLHLSCDGQSFAYRVVFE